MPKLRITPMVHPCCGADMDVGHNEECPVARANTLASIALQDADTANADAAWFRCFPWMPYRTRPATPEEIRDLRTRGIALLPGVRVRVDRVGRVVVA